MSLTQLTDKIIQDAETKKASILKVTNEYAQKKEEGTKNLSAEKRIQFEKELEIKLSENTEKTIRQAEHEVKNLIDSTKRSVLDDVFIQTLTILEESGNDVYEKVVTSLLENIPSSIEGVLFVQQKRISSIKKILTTKNISCLVQADDSIKDGFIIKGKNFEYNGTFEKLLTEKKKNLEVDIAHLLFS